VRVTPAVPSDPVVALVTEPLAERKTTAAPDIGSPLESLSEAVVQPEGTTT
jgi:hypothetical protein